ncbi:beta-class carbonic anhydrase [Neisseria animalis]|uniref:Carbonic anhydrase n=1 Tax=Neisseria animalis TaxID=492 RepID=A0A5P3MTN0_NEIAN|nr:carbonic anhydrase [Neisseria animalis]QEY23999.1 carbonic anhydrase [Neisseria animalis]ROW32565.1 carbonic anhydrase [Neisseria animalis]VEE06040.1 carbonic anhydrase [Neisseria animalis]
MSELNHILSYNQDFVESGEYAQFFTGKYPERGLAILSCMDARIIELLPRALGLKNGDAKLIKNAGALVTHPWGSVMRSLLVAVFELKVKEIMVIAHHDCGMQKLNAESFLGKAADKGIPEDRVETLRNAGIDLDSWLTGFDNVEDSVRHTVSIIRRHPLMPAEVAVHGLVIHPTTGKLTLVVDGSTGSSADGTSA